MMEQLGEKCSLMKRKLDSSSLRGQNDGVEMYFGSVDDYNQLVLNQNYKKLQDTNKQLNFELNDLRIKLVDAESDIGLLREKIIKLKKNDANYSDNIIDNVSDSTSKVSKSQHLIEQIEKLKMKNKELEKDLKLYLDEKEDLIKDRNNYIQKAERLNENLNALMKSEDELSKIKKDNLNKKSMSSLDSSKFLDIDSILSENVFLKEKLKCLEKDQKFSQGIINKYKQALDKTNSNKKNFFELNNLTKGKKGDSSNLNSDSLSIVSTRELQSFIASNNLDNLELNDNTLLSLRKLVLTLFESMNDSNTALNLAKTNNKLLGKRINDLESKIRDYENREKNQRIESFKINKLNDQINPHDTNNRSDKKIEQNPVEDDKNLKFINLKNENKDLNPSDSQLMVLVEKELEKLKDK